MAMQGRAKMAERAFQEGISGRVATILGADPEGYKEDLREQMLRANIPEASLEPALKGRRDRYAEATTADGQPVSIDRKTGLVKKHGEGSDWDKTITLGGIAYQYDRATQSLKRLGGVVTPEPGKTTSEIGPDGTARPLISAPAAPSDMTLKGYELWLGEVPRNPTPEQTRYAAGVGKLATVLGEDAILKAKSAGVLDRLLGIVGDTTPGTPAGDVSADLSNKAAGVVDTAQRDEKVLVARKQGEAAAQIREDTMKRAPAVAVEGLRSPETEIYDLTTGKKVDKLRPGIMADAEKNPGRYRIVQGDDTKSLRAVAGIEKFVPMFEEVSKRLTDQPGANVVQQIEFALKDRFGVADMNTVVSTMQGSQLVLAKAFQGTGSQLSDADRKTVEGLVPKSGDTGQQVMQKVNFLKTYTRLIRAAVLDDDAAADNALVDFVKNLPRTGGGKGGQIVPGQGIQVVP